MPPARSDLAEAPLDPDATVRRPWAEALASPAARAADPDATVIRVPVASIPGADPDATIVHQPQALPGALAQTQQLALPEGFRLHEYRIDRVLGQGGFGITYLATDVNLSARVAIKEYLPAEIAFRAGDRSVSPNASQHRDRYRQGLDAFLAEARTLASFRHPAIVRVARFFEAHRTAYMVLEYEAGQSLKSWWPQHHEVGEARLVELLTPLLDGLALLHRGGVLHRDIKPDNIQVRERDGSFVLLDFGSSGQALVVPDAEAVIVTPGYAPPEQYGLGSDTAQGPWTDLYALAATLYWMVGGRKPPDAELRLISRAPLPLARETGAGRYGLSFLTAIDNALALDPRERPRSIDAWRRQLFADHLDTLALQDVLRLKQGDESAGRRGFVGRLRQLLARLNPAAWALATKLTLAFVLTALLPMALAGWYNLGHSLQAVSAAELENQEQLARSVAGRLGQLISDTRHVARGLGSDQQIADVLTHPDDAVLREALREKLQRRVQANPDVQLMIVLDREGQALISSDPEVVGRNFAFRQYFQRAMAGELFVTGLTVGAVAGATGMFFADGVRDAQQNLVGVAVLRLRGLAISAILDEVNQHGVTPFLIDDDGVLIHHPREDLVFRSMRPLPAPTLAAIRNDQRFRRNEILSLNQLDLAQAMVGAKASGNVSYKSALSGKDEIAGFAPVPGNGWVVAVSESRESFEAPLRRLYQQLGISLLLVGLLFTGLALLFARSIVRPVRELTRGAEALKSGDFDAARVAIERRDELGVLARTFNVMIDVLRQRERERQRRRE